MVVVGRDRRDPAVALADEYLSRLAHYFPAEVVEVREEPATRSNPVERVQAVEAERLRKALLPGEVVVALDERGRELSSTELAARLDRWAQAAVPSVAFVIGGPNGLDPAWAASATERWSLSRLTLPHRLARLVLVEQLYRAGTILRGEPYHR